MHDIYFDTLNASGIANTVDSFITGLAFNPVTKPFAAASAGGPQGLALEPSFWVEQSISWANADDDAAIEDFVVDVNTNIQSKLVALNATSQYTYLNDADKGQAVFETYGGENLMRLKEIRMKYDPSGVFTELMPGGFKVAKA